MEKINPNLSGVLGFGHVGKAIAKLYPAPKIKDRTRDDGLKGADVLNVCIPYFQDFVKMVVNEILLINPKLVIIHSTVAPGTTKKIQARLAVITEKSKTLVVHSPVRGVHPNLYEGVKTFTKYIGADVLEAGIMAEQHFRDIKLKPKAFGPSIITELGKLLSTTYYGLCIAFHGEMRKMCTTYKIPFDQVATHFNETYNKGYAKLEKSNVIRPVLHSPPPEGIGGHCIIENARVLDEIFNSKALDLILSYAPKGE